MNLELPSEKYKKSYLEAVKEFLEKGEYLEREHLKIGLESDFSEHIQSIRDKINIEKVKEGKVPETIYWLIDNE